MATLDEYTALITSQHNQQPNYMSMLSLLGTPLVAGQNAALGINQKYDLDNAVGKQLDTVGKWIGLSRQVPVPITGVYFSWDTAGVGWGQGVWQGPFDPASGLTQLDDDTYRLFLRAKIAANHWDGTYAGYLSILNALLSSSGVTVSLFDGQDMTMSVVFTGTALTPLQKALITGGYFTVKPVGVRITGYFTPSVPSTPVFAFDAPTGTSFGGWDVGSWGTSF